jgi:asparagine synthase (glutamine-hydrolysing)
VKVVTSGLGADELFGGYSHFSDFPRYAGEAKRPWDPLGSWIYGRVPNRYCYDSYLRDADEAERVLGLRRVNLDVDLAHLRGGRWGVRKTMTEFRSRLEGWLAEPRGLQRKLSLIESRHYLLNTLLRDSDVLSMASGLELRPIFLDHTLAELAFALPDAAKVDGGKGKVVLRDLADRLLPAEILERPKRGFDLPKGAWLSTTLGDRLDEAMSHEVTRALFPPDYLKRCRFQRSRPRIERQAWALLVLASWMEKTGCEFAGEGVEVAA